MRAQRNNRRVWIGLGAVMMLTASGAVVHGRLSNRWGPSQSMIEAGGRLQRIPASMETWQLQSSGQLSETAKSMLESAGDVTRNYIDSATKSAVNLSVIVGPAGPVSVHSPEICFPARNYKLLAPRRRVKIRDARGVDHEFWKVEFKSQDLNGRRLPVYYAWSTGGPWIAAENPRYRFAGIPYLYKIQLVGYASPAALNRSEDPVPAFLRVLLPAAENEIVTASLND